ncbi:unnamed protein product, partial [Rotaria sp. Silwood2]
RAVDLLSSSRQNDLQLAAALNNLGAIYQACGSCDKAREYFERSRNKHPCLFKTRTFGSSIRAKASTA